MRRVWETVTELRQSNSVHKAGEEASPTRSPLLESASTNSPEDGQPNTSELTLIPVTVLEPRTEDNDLEEAIMMIWSESSPAPQIAEASTRSSSSTERQGGENLLDISHNQLTGPQGKVDDQEAVQREFTSHKETIEARAHTPAAECSSNTLMGNKSSNPTPCLPEQPEDGPKHDISQVQSVHGSGTSRADSLHLIQPTRSEDTYSISVYSQPSGHDISPSDDPALTSQEWEADWNPQPFSIAEAPPNQPSSPTEDSASTTSLDVTLTALPTVPNSISTPIPRQNYTAQHENHALLGSVYDAERVREIQLIRKCQSTSKHLEAAYSEFKTLTIVGHPSSKLHHLSRRICLGAITNTQYIERRKQRLWGLLKMKEEELDILVRELRRATEARREAQRLVTEDVEFMRCECVDLRLEEWTRLERFPEKDVEWDYVRDEGGGGMRFVLTGGLKKVGSGLLRKVPSFIRRVVDLAG